MPAHSTFYGPAALWLPEGESEDIALQYALEEAKTRLKVQLQRRIQFLSRSDVTLDDLLMEIRRQIAACAVDGHITEAGDLQEVALAVVEIYHQSRRA